MTTAETTSLLSCRRKIEHHTLPSTVYIVTISELFRSSPHPSSLCFRFINTLPTTLSRPYIVRLIVPV